MSLMLYLRASVFTLGQWNRKD